VSIESRLKALEDMWDVAQVFYRYAASLDARDWESYRSLFAEIVEINFASMGPDWLTMTRDEWVAGRVHSGLDSCQHVMSNPQVTVDGDQATCLIYVVAEHFLTNPDGDHWHTMGGLYRASLSRFAEGWRIRKLQLTVIWKRGNPQIMDLARSRLSAATAKS
jgi:hypothetical protein